MARSLSFGSNRKYNTHLLRLHLNNLSCAFSIYSLIHYTKGTPSIFNLLSACKHSVSIIISHSLSPFPSRYLCTIDQKLYLDLESGFSFSNIQYVLLKIFFINHFKQGFYLLWPRVFNRLQKLIKYSLIRVRSLLLTESRLISFPLVT